MAPPHNIKEKKESKKGQEKSAKSDKINPGRVKRQKDSAVHELKTSKIRGAKVLAIAHKDCRD